MRNSYLLLTSIGLFTWSTTTPASIVLNGTIRDFCSPALSTSATRCDLLLHDTNADGIPDTPDFQGEITDVVPGMLSTTLDASGLPQYVASAGAGAADANSFAKWYRDDPTYNSSAPFSLTLDETGPGTGVFEYTAADFFPIDGQLFGNQGRARNYHFTLHLMGLLSFDGLADGDDAFFSFLGDDDLWVYIDGQQFIDIGGIHAATSGSFTESNLLAAGLLPNTPYSLDIFFAERRTSQSNFSIRTSLDIASEPFGVPEPGTLLLLSLGILGIRLRQRRRADRRSPIAATAA